MHYLRSRLEMVAKPWFTLNYHGYRIKFDFCPRTQTCTICGTKGYSNIHHTLYNFSRREVQDNNRLALLFTFEVCYQDHLVANAVRMIMEQDPNVKIKTSSEKVRKIFENHQRLYKERNIWNKKHRINGKIVI